MTQEVTVRMSPRSVISAEAASNCDCVGKRARDLLGIVDRSQWSKTRKGPKASVRNMEGRVLKKKGYQKDIKPALELTL